jgi:hypothetical protein
MNYRLIILLPFIALLLTACGSKKTISGEYRSAFSADDQTGKVVADLMYDLRSDGTFTMEHSMEMLGTSVSSTGKGTYTINGHKVELTQTSFTVRGETTEHVSHETMSLEDNGDLITQNGVRLKKQ